MRIGVRQRRRSGKRRFGCLFYLIMLTLLGGMGVAGWLVARDLLDYWVDDDRFDSYIQAAAAKYAVDSRLIKAVIFEESRFDPAAVGSSGEIGLMQVLPSGAVADWAEEQRQAPPSTVMLFSPELNIEIGSWYLGKALRRWQQYEHGTELALCQYNAGGSRAENWKPPTPDGEVLDRIDFKSTRRYVENIMARYRDYCEEAEQ